MELERIAQGIIFFHAFSGGVALLSGGLALSSKKGEKLHKISGKVFFYAMLLSALSALIVAVFPNHENPFLFVIGLFSMYLILTGYRALVYKKRGVSLKVDQAISWSMLTIGLTMILFPVLLKGVLNIVLTVFGVIGIIFSFRDLMLYRDSKRLKQVWLKLHVGKMTGGYIAATTAFVVVNNVFPSIYGWFIPGVIGGGYIAYWMRKLKK